MLLFISTRHAQTSTHEQSEISPPVSEKGAHEQSEISQTGAHEKE